MRTAAKSSSGFAGTLQRCKGEEDGGWEVINKILSGRGWRLQDADVESNGSKGRGWDVWEEQA